MTFIEILLYVPLKLLSIPLLIVRRYYDLLRVVDKEDILKEEKQDSWLTLITLIEANHFHTFEEFHKVRMYNDVLIVEKITTRKFLELWFSNSIESIIQVDGLVEVGKTPDNIVVDLFADCENDKYRAGLAKRLAGITKKNKNYILASYSEDSVYEMD